MPAEAVSMTFTIGPDTPIVVREHENGGLALYLGVFDKTLIILGEPKDLVRLSFTTRDGIGRVAESKAPAGRES